VRTGGGCDLNYPGFVTFVITRFITIESLALTVALPVVVSTVTYVLMGLMNRNRPVPERVKILLESIAKEE
jgi:solute:Na+ symporter, SSS family